MIFGTRPQIATADEIRDASRQAYADVRALGVEFNPAPIANVAHRIEHELTGLGLTERNVPETYGVIHTLQTPAPRGAVMTAGDLENARQELVQASQNATNRREAVAARAAINHLDDFAANVSPRDVLRGDAAAALAALALLVQVLQPKSAALALPASSSSQSTSDEIRHHQGRRRYQRDRGRWRLDTAAWRVGCVDANRWPLLDV